MAKAKIVMAFGTFDLLHEGHIFYLKKAKSLGKKLIVVIARDSTVKKLKKRTPLNNENSRKKIIKSLKFVDLAVLGKDYFKDKTEIIKKFKPDILAFGYDQMTSIPAMKKFLKEKGINVKVHVIKAFKERKFNSSLLKRKILSK